METLNYEIEIKAPIQKVWDLLWNEETYTLWTQFFSDAESSHMKSDWKVGGQTLFLGSSGNGMYSTITTLNEPTEVVFSHLGTYNDGVIDTKSREVEEWSGAEEKYFLRSIDENATQLRVILHTMQEYKEHMDKGFEKGLALLKELAEK